eukprot:TRINITY_DN8942_c0_g1_i1.p4 TRINITY_DN8942_c0_g1~~TRINITY_DN8942_c0_g1_i1.p4  ORF type:complete len:115 (+),score=16.14 TRINITY_DN8942_c0_g1_i1:136-480(+)
MSSVLSALNDSSESLSTSVSSLSIFSKVKLSQIDLSECEGTFYVCCLSSLWFGRKAESCCSNIMLLFEFSLLGCASLFLEELGRLLVIRFHGDFIFGLCSWEQEPCWLTGVDGE